MVVKNSPAYRLFDVGSVVLFVGGVVEMLLASPVWAIAFFTACIVVKMDLRDAREGH